MLRNIVCIFQDARTIVCLLFTGLLLLTTPLSSDCWTELRLRRVARCSTKDPVLYEHGCKELRWTDHQVARAGLWIVCYSFPRGIIPEMYFRTDPYCADFDDDLYPAEWLDDARLLCVLAPILATFGLVANTAGACTNAVNVQQISSVLFVFSGLSAVMGALKMFIHMNKYFLIPDRRARVEQITHWPFYSMVCGSILLTFAGVLGHIDKRMYCKRHGERKNV